MITLHFNNTTLDVQADDSSYRYRALSRKPQLILKFSLPYNADIPVGAYCDYMEERYILHRDLDLNKQGVRNIEYTLTMGTDEDKLGFYKMRNSIDKRLKYSLFATPREFMQEIVDNLNDKFGANVWSVGDVIEAPAKMLEFNHSYIDAALQSVAELFETEYEIVGYTIHLHRVEYFKDSPLPLSYGKGNGFQPGVGRMTPSGEEPIKRLYVQGGEKNIDRSKYGSAELLLPISQLIEYEGRKYISSADGLYIERYDKVSDAVKEDSIDCSDIYPQREGTVSTVVEVDASKNFYDFIDDSIPENLDFNDCLIGEEKPIIRFQTGMLSGEKDFEFKYIHSERRFEIVPQEIDGQIMPNATFKPAIGDTYAVFNIMLPNAYICDNVSKTGASYEMFKVAAKHLYEHEDKKFTFKGTLQGLYAKRNWLNIGGKLKVGGYVLFSDTQFVPDGVSIRIVGIKDYLTSPYTPEIELSNSVSGGGSVNSQLAEIKKQEVVIDSTKREILAFTKRRFRDTKETIELLEGAMLNFSDSIDPISVQTMSMLAGDESLQFRFVNSKSNLTPVTYNITYDNSTKQLHCPHGFLQHMTLGITSISNSHKSVEYKVWEISEYLSPVLTDGTKKYYLYVKVSRADTNVSGNFFLSETAISIDAESGYYHLLVGVLNSEYENSRSYVSLYGYTEVLPGRITTDRIVSSDGNTYFDLENNIIKGNFMFLSNGQYVNPNYLIDAMQNDSEVIGGLLLTQFVGLRENSNIIRAFINGNINAQLGGLLNKSAFAAGVSDFGTNKADAMVDIKHDGFGSRMGVFRLDNDGIAVTDNMGSRCIIITNKTLENGSNDIKNFESSGNNIALTTYISATADIAKVGDNFYAASDDVNETQIYKYSISEEILPGTYDFLLSANHLKVTLSCNVNFAQLYATQENYSNIHLQVSIIATLLLNGEVLAAETVNEYIDDTYSYTGDTPDSRILTKTVDTSTLFTKPVELIIQPRNITTVELQFEVKITGSYMCYPIDRFMFPIRAIIRDINKKEGLVYEVNPNMNLLIIGSNGIKLTQLANKTETEKIHISDSGTILPISGSPRELYVEDGLVKTR